MSTDPAPDDQQITLTFDSGRLTGSWSPEAGFTGDREVVESAHAAAACSFPTRITPHVTFYSGSQSLMEALAALASYDPAGFQIEHLDARAQEALSRVLAGQEEDD